jgi:hypothetical protein
MRPALSPVGLIRAPHQLTGDAQDLFSTCDPPHLLDGAQQHHLGQRGVMVLLIRSGISAKQTDPTSASANALPVLPCIVLLSPSHRGRVWRFEY